MVFSSLAQYGVAIVVAVATLVILTTVHFALKHKFLIPGPTFVTPILGGLIGMIRDPYGFWQHQADMAAKTGLSWNSIVSKYMVFATRADFCHKIFNANSPDTLTLVLHPNAYFILGTNNIAFQTGPSHRALRSSFMQLFTPKALSFYLTIQDKCIREHLAAWCKVASPVEMRDRIRDLNLQTSQAVFVGPYIEDREAFNTHYMNMTNGFLAVPIYFPGTKLYTAVQSRKEVVKVLTKAVKDSKTLMAVSGNEPRSLLDYWTHSILDEIVEAKQHDRPIPEYSTDHNMAETMMDFLFASQDASTASLTWLTSLMADNPDILRRVREEQRMLRPHGEPLTYELVQMMTFTRQCILEQLRYMPAAPMVPMLAHAPFKLNDEVTVPKGTMLIPSLVACCREGFPQPERYDPDRMGDERQEHVKFSRQYIPFGVGPHRCVGYNYAIGHLTAYLAIIATDSTWERTRTKDSDRILYLPTLYPYDCICKWNAVKP